MPIQSQNISSSRPWSDSSSYASTGKSGRRDIVFPSYINSDPMTQNLPVKTVNHGSNHRLQRIYSSPANTFPVALVKRDKWFSLHNACCLPLHHKMVPLGSDNDGLESLHSKLLTEKKRQTQFEMAFSTIKISDRAISIVQKLFNAYFLQSIERYGRCEVGSHEDIAIQLHHEIASLHDRRSDKPHVVAYSKVLFRYFEAFERGIMARLDKRVTGLQHTYLRAMDGRCYRSLGLRTNGEYLGKGAFGVVRTIESLDGKKFAVKKISYAPKGHRVENGERDLQGHKVSRFKAVRAEIGINQWLPEHKNILKYDNVISAVSCKNSPKLYLVMPLLNGGTLGDLVNSEYKMYCVCSKTSLDQRRLWASNIAKQLISGIAALHQEGIYHRDIKLKNILLDDQGVIKICDFGLSEKLPEGRTVGSGERGTKHYKAPELESEVKTFCLKKADFYSVGVSLRTLCERLEIPLRTELNADDFAGGFPTSLDALVASLTEANPGQRAAFSPAGLDRLMTLGEFAKAERLSEEKKCRIHQKVMKA